MVWQGNYSKLYMGGQWVTPATDESIAVVSPFTEEVIAHVPAASRADVDRAVAMARDAFDNGPWPRMSLADRLSVLDCLSRELEARQEQMASLISAEMGCPISLSRTMQTAGGLLLLDSFIDLAPQYTWSTLRRSKTGNALVTREPVGVVAAVVPWNAPLLVTVLKLAPALLSGCTVILKPSPEAPLDAYLLADMVAETGLPAGVVGILPAYRDVSEYLVSHPGVDKVSFTGSTAAGRRIAARCGQDLRRVTLELGGKSAAVILDDADLDVAMESIRALSLRNTGQACSNKTRIVVSRTREAELLDRMAEMVGSLNIGDPADPATHVGPLVSARQRESVEGYIDIGRREGAEVLVGGNRPAGLDRGWFVEPTVFVDVDPSMRIAREEIFGPVLSVIGFDGEDEAVAIANDSDYGLNGSVFTTDPEHALAVARRIRTGTVELNGHGAGFHAPMGGFKSSGIGREAGLEGFDAYVEPKSYGLPAALADALS
ncbi:aldehyde dehydrogenase [Embleya sp. MST-111070]|uniref:aldehyde dehydrogenase n=1 Tax=Embleya sp. MST-111070 TaxID=3398231 RepID=UPI003F731CFF